MLFRSQDIAECDGQVFRWLSYSFYQYIIACSRSYSQKNMSVTVLDPFWSNSAITRSLLSDLSTAMAVSTPRFSQFVARPILLLSVVGSFLERLQVFTTVSNLISSRRTLFHLFISRVLYAKLRLTYIACLDAYYI